MALWKVLGGKARAVEETTFKEQQILESGIEDWVESSPGLLGEPLLIIGRQVVIHDLNDRIDLLALDPEGNVVVVEVKREDITAPVDIQAARYASYVSNWKPLDLERVWAEYANDGDPERTLEASFAEFVESVGADEDTTLNRNQRLLIVGQRVRNRLGSVALWLREQGVDIKLVELHPFLDGEELYIEPLVIIPPPSTEKWERVGQRDDTDSKPWLTDGKGWHSQRGGAEALERTQALTGALELAGVVHSVSYNQKH